MFVIDSLQMWFTRLIAVLSHLMKVSSDLCSYFKVLCWMDETCTLLYNRDMRVLFGYFS